jgi:hypothetical protein
MAVPPIGTRWILRDSGMETFENGRNGGETRPIPEITAACPEFDRSALL